MNATRSRTLSCVATALLIFATTASAQEKGRRQRPQQVPPTGAEDSAEALPEDPEGVETLDAITSRSTEGLTFEHRGDGTIGLDLQGRFMHVLRATPGKDGHLEVSCETGSRHGKEAHAKAATAVKPWRPVRGLASGAVRGKPLPAPIRVAADKAPAAEEK
jgi:hypothetical protein